MGIVATLNRLEGRYAWSLLGFVLAAIFGGITLYTEFIRDTRPILRFEVITDASVLDVREPISDLQIVYGGVDIQKTRQALRVLIVRVINVGLQDILRDHYDDRSPLGFRVNDGSLVRVELLSSSNEYIRQTVTTRVVDARSVVFNPLIIESQEWFTVKCLVLYADGTRPTIEPFGKVAGVRSIRLVTATDATAQPSFWYRTLSGSIGTQLARFAVYSVAFIVALVAFIGTAASISELATKRSRRRKILQFKAVTTRRLDQRDEFIFDSYLTAGEVALRVLSSIAGDPSRIEKQMKVRRKRARAPRGATSREVQEVQLENGEIPTLHEAFDPSVAILHEPSFWPLDFEQMKETKVIYRNPEDKWAFDEHASETLTDFKKFLKLDQKHDHLMKESESR